ncbi:hypothetical protein [Sulfurisphaera javensis]
MKAVLSGLIGGIAELVFFVNDFDVFSTISFHILHISSIFLGILLHLIASMVVFLVAVKILESVKIRSCNYLSAFILGLLLGSAVLSLFSLPIHLLIFPIKITLSYVMAHIFYGVISYFTYFTLTKSKKVR